VKCFCLKLYSSQFLCFCVSMFRFIVTMILIFHLLISTLRKKWIRFHYFGVVLKLVHICIFEVICLKLLHITNRTTSIEVYRSLPLISIPRFRTIFGSFFHRIKNQFLWFLVAEIEARLSFNFVKKRVLRLLVEHCCIKMLQAHSFLCMFRSTGSWCCASFYYAIIRIPIALHNAQCLVVSR